jgi:hypothetical protein
VSSNFVRDLRQALLDDLEPEILLACRVAALMAAGWLKGTEIAAYLGCTTLDVDRARRRLKRAAAHLGSVPIDEF